MPLTRTQVYRRRRVVVFGGLGLALGIAFYLPLTMLAPLRAVSAEIVPVEIAAAAAPVVDWPDYGASAVGAIGFPGVLGQSGSDHALPMASITKVITALVVLDAHPLGPDDPGPTITTTAADVQHYRDYLAQNGKVTSVRAGLELSQRDLLDLTLVESANNYTLTLTLWAFGSVDAFVDAAGAWLDAHGLSGIRVVEPTGIDAGNTATAADLVELARLALADPAVAPIVGTASFTVAGLGDFETTNELLGSQGVTGIKTGTLDDFGANLLFSAEYPVGGSWVTVVGVVLGGPDHDALNRDILALLNGVAAGFTEVTVATDGEVFGAYRTVWDGTADAVAAEDATLVVWGDTPITAEVTAADVTSASAGADVGEAVFTAGTRTVTVELELARALEDPGPWWRFTHPWALF
jgi:D-alanyl-D-alanine carboxypeptidase (penicillin-binding protein 5/6)